MIILAIVIFAYLAYEKRCQTKQIDAISNMHWLSYEQINELIDKVM